MAQVGGSKAKYLRDLLDKTLEIKIPNGLTAEEFERFFNFRVSEEEIPNLTFGEVMIRQLIFKAASGNDRSIQEVLDRLLGKPMQTIESTSKSYTYHDFLIECREADKREIGQPNFIPTEIPQIPPAPEEESDPAQDLI